MSILGIGSYFYSNDHKPKADEIPNGLFWTLYCIDTITCSLIHSCSHDSMRWIAILDQILLIAEGCREMAQRLSIHCHPIAAMYTLSSLWLLEIAYGQSQPVCSVWASNQQQYKFQVNLSRIQTSMLRSREEMQRDRYDQKETVERDKMIGESTHTVQVLL